MSAVLKGILGLSAPLRQALLGQRARLTSKISAREIGTAESVIGLTVMSAVMLVPAAWFLAHIEKYKKRE